MSLRSVVCLLGPNLFTSFTSVSVGYAISIGRFDESLFDVNEDVEYERLCDLTIFTGRMELSDLSSSSLRLDF